MEQPLSVALTVDLFLALPWLPPLNACAFGAASFSRLALRARRKAYLKASNATVHQSLIDLGIRHTSLNNPSSECEARGRNETQPNQ
jgi:hypothetical protein